MSLRRDLLEQNALDAATRLFSDTSVTRDESILSLKWLQDEIDALIDALQVGR